MTDGRYTYFLYPPNIADQQIFEYTLMPTHQQLPFAVEEFAGTELSDGFNFTQGYPLLKIPARPHPRRGQGANIEDTDTVLYDLQSDPGQLTPITNPEVTERLKAEVGKILKLHDAPPEAFTRLGLG